MLNICVIGAGAVGALYGAKLAQAGACVSVLCRSDYNYVSQHGFHIKSTWGDFNFTPYQVVSDVADFSVVPDLVIVATKVAPNTDIKELLGPLVNSNCPILLLQNGMFIEAPYQDAFPNLEIWSGLAFVCVVREGAGTIHHQDYGLLEIGGYVPPSSPLCHDVATLWSQSGVPCRVSNTIQKTRWEKLVWNAPFNPLSVIYQTTTDKLLSNLDTETRVRAIMQEVCQLAVCDGYPLDPDIIDLKISQTKKMTPYKTSMLLDFEFGRPIESEAVLGSVIRFADRKGQKVPYLEALYNELNSKVDGQ